MRNVLPCLGVVAALAMTAPSTSFALPVPCAIDFGVLPFAESAVQAHTIDLDGDAIPDLVRRFLTPSSDVQRLRFDVGLGNGAFAFHSEFDIPTTAFEIGDIDGDGRNDVRVCDGFEMVYLHATATGEFEPLPTSIQVGRLHDITGDGLADVVDAKLEGGTYTIIVHVGDGTGQFFPAAPAIGGTGGVGVEYVVGDINGDGFGDIVQPSSDNRLVVLFGTASGELVRGNPILTGATPTEVALGDLDGDGDLDAAWSDFATLLAVAYGDGAGGFGAPLIVAAEAAPAVLDTRIVDIDLDGEMDVALIRVTEGIEEMILYFGDGTGFPLSHVVPVSATREQWVDLDGDGDPDRLSPVTIRWNHLVDFPDCDGNGVPDSCDIAAGGDVDGDGLLDVCQSFQRGQIIDDGTIGIGDAIALLSAIFGPATLDCEDAGDVNDDGTIDIGDPITLLGALFVGPVPPPEPWVDCGPDPTADALGCAVPPACP
ncbi:MAG: VCBS repeat-containing protein [Planctomycetes bacterium]|nr:VCBS repeat-containing protein [Planctomycetota bacterium]